MTLIYSPKEMLIQVILVQLAKGGPHHGYALANVLESNFGWKPSMTSIYNLLKQLELDNVVKVEERIERNRVQKVYSITKKGIEVLEEHQKKFREKMKRNVSHFFSILESVGYFSSEPNEKQEVIQQNLLLLRKIFILSIRIINSSNAGLGQLHRILVQTFSNLEKLTTEYDIPTIDLCEEDNV